MNSAMTVADGFEAALAAWLVKAQAVVDAYFAENYPTQGATLSLDPGKRYVRVVRAESSCSRSVHCFIDATNGDVLKAASWKAPAKGARGNIYTDALGVTAHGGIYR